MCSIRVTPQLTETPSTGVREKRGWRVEGKVERLHHFNACYVLGEGLEMRCGSLPPGNLICPHCCSAWQHWAGLLGGHGGIEGHS